MHWPCADHVLLLHLGRMSGVVLAVMPLVAGSGMLMGKLLMDNDEGAMAELVKDASTHVRVFFFFGRRLAHDILRYRLVSVPGCVLPFCANTLKMWETLFKLMGLCFNNGVQASMIISNIKTVLSTGQAQESVNVYTQMLNDGSASKSHIVTSFPFSK